MTPVGVLDRVLPLQNRRDGSYDVDGVHIDDYFYPYPETVKGKGKSK